MQSHIERALPIDDARFWGDGPVSSQAGNFNTVGDTSPRIGLPLLNWPAPPRMKLNTLWWPTGATRWALGLFLASAKQMGQIWEKLGGETSSTSFSSRISVVNGGSPGSGTLILKNDNASDQVSATMYLLDPRPITLADLEFSGYLLPLVDERYLWQYQDAGDLSGVTTWNDLLTALGTALGTTPSMTTVAAAYKNPDPQEMLRSYENVAVLLDAMAASTGRRVVRSLAGGVSLMTASESQAAVGHGYYSAPITAGDMPSAYVANALPPTVRVAFPAYYYNTREPTNGYFVYDSDTQGGNGTQQRDGEATIFTTAGAAYTGDIYPPDFTTEPDNHTEVTALAEAITADYIAHIQDGYDISFAGLNAGWQMSGFDDYVWYHFGYQHPVKPTTDGNTTQLSSYAAYTRVASLPHNVGMPVQLQQFADVKPYALPMWYQLTEDLGHTIAHEASANPGQWDASGNSGAGSLSVDTSTTLTVTDTLGTRTGGNGCWARCRPVGADNGTVWEIVYLESPRLRFFSGTLPSALASTDASKASVTLAAIDGGPDPSGSQTVYNPFGLSGASSAPFIAYQDQNDSGKYKFVCVLEDTAYTDQSMVTNFQVDGTNKLFQIKTRTLRTYTNSKRCTWQGSESGWTTAHTGGACP